MSRRGKFGVMTRREKPHEAKRKASVGCDLEVVTNTLTMAEARVSAQARGKLFCNSLEITQGAKRSFCLQAVIFICTELGVWLLCIHVSPE